MQQEQKLLLSSQEANRVKEEISNMFLGLFDIVSVSTQKTLEGLYYVNVGIKEKENIQSIKLELEKMNYYVNVVYVGKISAAQ